MDRLLRHQPGVLSVQWERDGELVDPGAVTVTVVRDSDGSVVVSGVAATSASGSATGPAWTVTLTAAQTTQLDSLTATWTAADGSVMTTYAEVTGGFLFSIAQARQRSPLSDTNSYPVEAMLFYRTLAEMALEDLCGVAFVPRYTRETVRQAGWGLLRPGRRRIRTVRQITTMTDQGPQALSTLSGLRIENGSSIFMPAFWSWYSNPIQVAYEHGYDFPPPRVSRAAIELARRWIIESPWDERMTSFRTRDGGQMSILTTSHSDAFDIPEVVAVADQYGMPMVG